LDAGEVHYAAEVCNLKTLSNPVLSHII
jgi:hypothetical protein